jgi:hypothetical protein
MYSDELDEIQKALDVCSLYLTDEECKELVDLVLGQFIDTKKTRYKMNLEQAVADKFPSTR